MYPNGNCPHLSMLFAIADATNQNLRSVTREALAAFKSDETTAAYNELQASWGTALTVEAICHSSLLKRTPLNHASDKDLLEMAATDKLVGTDLAHALLKLALDSILQDLIVQAKVEGRDDLTFEELKDLAQCINERSFSSTFIEGKVAQWNVSLELVDADQVWLDSAERLEQSFETEIQQVLENHLTLKELGNTGE